MSAPVTDPEVFRHTKTADANRTAKAKAIAAFAWDRGLSHIDLAGFPPERLRAFARAAGQNPPSTDETWALVRDLLAQKEMWAWGNPDHPGTARKAQDDAARWRDDTIRWEPEPVTTDPPVAKPDSDGSDEHNAPANDDTAEMSPLEDTEVLQEGNTCPPDGPMLQEIDIEDPPEPPPVVPEPREPVVVEQIGPVEPAKPVDPPRGWDAIAQLAPLEPTRPCFRCRMPAVIRTQDGDRCPKHPPLPAEWGYTLDWTPNPHRAPCLTRCYCGRCPHYTRMSSTGAHASQVIDDRHALSGKARAGGARRYAEAKANKAARRG